MTTSAADAKEGQLADHDNDVNKLAHDLRTPLCVILAYAELLASGKAGPLQPKQSKYVNNISCAARQISDYIERLEINPGDVNS